MRALNFGSYSFAASSPQRCLISSRTRSAVSWDPRYGVGVLRICLMCSILLFANVVNDAPLLALFVNDVYFIEEVVPLQSTAFKIQTSAYAATGTSAGAAVMVTVGYQC